MENHRNWEGYISSYLMRPGLDSLLGEPGSSVRRSDRDLIIKVLDIEVTFTFHSYLRQMLVAVGFRSTMSGTWISFPTFYMSMDHIPLHEGRAALEAYLGMPFITGWIEHVHNVRGRHYRTDIYTDMRQKRPYTIIKGDTGPWQGLRCRLGISFREEFTYYKGALLQYEERKRPT